MKKVLKGWIADNSVTADKTDKILVLESAGKVDIDDILEEMLKEDTGLRPETLRHAVELYNRIVMDFILNGYQVNTGLFYAVAKLTGILESGVWNKANNSIYVAFTQGKDLRKAISETSVSILGEKAGIMYILETEDVKTGRKDGSATAGRNIFVRGGMLKLSGEDPTVGIVLTDSKGIETKLEDDLIVKNMPSELTLLIPAELTTAEYTLTITTQYSHSSRQFLKTPRSVTTPIWIGGKPEEGGGDRPEIE